MVRRVDAYPIRISLVITGPPGWDSSRGWMVGKSKGLAMDKVLRDAARFVRESVPRLARCWSYRGAKITDSSVRLHATVGGPWNNAESVSVFEARGAAAMGKRGVEQIVRKTVQFIRREVARMEEAWNDTVRYWEWMHKQEEARRKGERGGTPPGKSS